jgi:hypothetical protein
MSDEKKYYFFHPRNATLFLFAVIAFALVAAPSISTSLIGTAAAAAPVAKATTTSAAVPQLLIQKDALGSGGGGTNTNPGNANDQNNNGTETTTPPPPTNPTTPGEKHFLIIGSSRQFTLTVSAQGTMTSTNVSVDGTISGIAELNPDNSIARIARDSLSGSIQVTDTDGNILATMDLNSLNITVKGTKVSVTSDFADQDNDRGRYTASFYASDNIVAPDVGNSGSVDLSNDNNQLSIVYTTANQRVTAADGNVAATLDFTA